MQSKKVGEGKEVRSKEGREGKEVHRTEWHSSAQASTAEDDDAPELA